MKTESLREFVVLARCGNYHTAAKELFITQSALSNHIKALEQELGFEFVNRSRGNELTEAGLIFLNTAQSILMEIDSMVQKCRGLDAGHEALVSPVKIAARSSFEAVSAALEHTCTHPFTYVECDERRPILSPFAAQTVDVMYTYDISIIPTLSTEAKELGLSFEPLGLQRCAITMSADNPLAGKQLTRKDLQEAEIVITSALEFTYWQLVLLDMIGADLGLRFRLVPIDNPKNIRLLELQDKIFVSCSSMAEMLFSHRKDCVIHHELDGSPLFMREGVIYRPCDENPSIDHVVGILRKHFGGV